MKISYNVIVKNEHGEAIYNGNFKKIPTMDKVLKTLKKEKVNGTIGSVWLGVPKVFVDYEKLEG